MRKKWLVRAAVMLGVCMATLLIAAPAMAMWTWCEVDPALSIGGHTVSVDASIQGDPQQILGNIVFNISVPYGTQVTIISSQPNATVNIQYSYWSFFWRSSRYIPVDVNVDINANATFNTKLIVLLDGQQVSQDTGNTHSDLDCKFIIQ